MSVENFAYKQLFAGCCCPVTDAGILVAGQNLAAGAVLGKITASGKLTLVDNAAVDGSQAPYAILAADVDATAADQACPLYKAGEFNENALTFGGDDTAADHKEALRDLGIFLKGSVKA